MRQTPSKFGRQAGLWPESQSAELRPTDLAQDRGRRTPSAVPVSGRGPGRSGGAPRAPDRVPDRLVRAAMRARLPDGRHEHLVVELGPHARDDLGVVRGLAAGLVPFPPPLGLGPPAGRLPARPAAAREAAGGDHLGHPQAVALGLVVGDALVLLLLLAVLGEHVEPANGIAGLRRHASSLACDATSQAEPARLTYADPRTEKLRARGRRCPAVGQKPTPRAVPSMIAAALPVVSTTPRAASVPSCASRRRTALVVRRLSACCRSFGANAPS